MCQIWRSFASDIGEGGEYSRMRRNLAVVAPTRPKRERENIHEIDVCHIAVSDKGQTWPTGNVVLRDAERPVRFRARRPTVWPTPSYHPTTMC